MSARAFLTRGLLAGLLAGIATFLVAYQVGEPPLEQAIALEEAGAPAPSGEGEAGGRSPTGADESAVVSRGTQRTWGLLAGSVAISVALGGIVALVAAGVAGRLGRLTPGQSTAVVSLIGFVAFALVPFLKYPANPPGVGSAETIGARTAYYFLFVLMSLAMAVAASVLATKVWERSGAYVAVCTGVGLYLVLVVVAGLLMPTVNEVGDFPADTLWFFRRASIITAASTWAVIGVVLTGLVGRLYRQTATASARRELAASL